jgi:hypothetical protein
MHTAGAVHCTSVQNVGGAVGLSFEASTEASGEPPELELPGAPQPPLLQI